MTNSEFIYIFPTTILHKSIDRQFLECELNIVNSNRDKIYKNTGNSMSINKYILDEPEMKDLKDICLKNLDYYLKEIYKNNEIEIYITQSWLNYANKNEFHHKHYHGNSFLSGVLYFDTNETDQIAFVNPIKDVIQIHPTQYDFKNARSWHVPVKNNDIVIFPSHLDHEVPNVIGDKTRISLGFNSFIKGNLGQLHYLNELKL
jgi:uncharacterized protein (TIGR02466 family)